jgi:RHS repeat-associated protein
MSYSYDNVGNVRSMTDTINGNLGIETTREYDALNRLTVNAQGNKRVDYTYNAISQVTNKKRYSDITGTNLVAETNHIYDSINRLTNIIHSNGANTISSYAQTYDAASKITSVTGTDGSSTYTYDDTNQLTGADYDFQADESYSYDGNGNRTNDGYVTGVNNQLLEDNKYLYEYDLVGNRTKRTDKSTNEVMEYRWDIRDRLTGITVKNDLGEIIRTAEYTYDVYNQRIAKTVDTDGDGSLAAVTERFVYGNDQNIALVLDENGNVNHRYLFGDGVDQIEADESNGNVRWALTDHLGSVRDVVDDSGTVLNHVVYDAFGGVTSQTDESVVFRYGYTARELDAESGLQYNRARYLDSFTGKFISEDPISFQGGDSNLYRYVYNNSTNFIDPSGNIPIAFLVPVAVKALTTIVGGVSFLLSLQPSQNQKNSVSPFIVHLLIALSVNSHPI